MIHPPQPTAAMDFGTALHCAVLEPIRFSKEYIAAPKVDRRTKEGKATWAAFEADNADKSVMDADDFLTVQRMRESAWAHPIAKQLLSGQGHNEVGAVWVNEETGITCKG
jgi:exodeoxyribonuclease VIII